MLGILLRPQDILKSLSHRPLNKMLGVTTVMVYSTQRHFPRPESHQANLCSGPKSPAVGTVKDTTTTTAIQQ